MWEYTFIEERDIKKAIEKANELGKEKWEAFGYATHTTAMAMTQCQHLILLKRQK